MSTEAWIATRDLKIGRRTLQAKIGLPVAVDEHTWRCELALGNVRGHSFGSDALQALTLAVEKVRQMSIEHAGVDWMGMGVG